MTGDVADADASAGAVVTPVEPISNEHKHTQ